MIGSVRVQARRQCSEQALDVMGVHHIELSLLQHSPHLQCERRIVDRQLAQVRSGRHLPVQRLPKYAMHGKRERLLVVGNVIRDQLDFVAATPQRIGQPLDAQRRAATCRHGARGHHGDSIARARAARAQWNAVGDGDCIHRRRSERKWPGAAPNQRVFERSATPGASGAITATRSTPARNEIPVPAPPKSEQPVATHAIAERDGRRCAPPLHTPSRAATLGK